MGYMCFVWDQVNANMVQIYYINTGTVCVCVCVCVSVRPREISGTEHHIATLLSLA